MNLIVDANVAIKWYVHENLDAEARRVLTGSDDLFAPEFLVVEIANVAWKKAVRKEITTQQAERIPEACRHAVPVLLSSARLASRATSIALHLQHPIYDCLYLACAEEVDGTVVTADARFLGAVKNSSFARMVRDLRAL